MEQGADLPIIPDRSLSERKVTKVLNKLTKRLSKALKNHPEAQMIVKGEVAREDQATESIPFAEGTDDSGKFVFSHIPEEIGVKVQLDADPLNEEGFFMDPWETPRLEYRGLENGRQVKYANSERAAANAFNIVRTVEQQLRPGN